MPLVFTSPYNNPVEGDMILGNVVQMDGITWRVVYIDTGVGECVLAKEYYEEEVEFDADQDNPTYIGSDLMIRCNEYCFTQLSTTTRKALIPKIVHGIETDLWVPQVNWVSSQTLDSSTPIGSWTGTNVFQYFVDNNSRIYTTKNGTSKTWWTASPTYSLNLMLYVTNMGIVNNNYSRYTNGFRPFCCVPYVEPKNNI